MKMEFLFYLNSNPLFQVLLLRVAFKFINPVVLFSELQEAILKTIASFTLTVLFKIY